MGYNNLPKEAQNYVRALAFKYSLELDIVIELFMMGGTNHTNYLCELKYSDCSDEFIRMENYYLWTEYNESIIEESSESEKAWKEFVVVFIDAYKIDKVLDWINRKLNNIK